MSTMRTASAPIISMRRSTRSATMPPSGPSATIGAMRAAVVSATHVAEPVRAKTRASRATLYSQSPRAEVARPSRRRWKGRPPGRRRRGVDVVAVSMPSSMRRKAAARTSGVRPLFRRPLPQMPDGATSLSRARIPSVHHRLGRLTTISSGVLRVSTTTASS